MYTLFICTSTFPFSYTLIGSLSDDPEFARLNWMFYLIDQVVLSLYTLQRPGVSLYLLVTGILISLLSLLISYPLYIAFSCYIIPYSYVIMCGHLNIVL